MRYLKALVSTANTQLIRLAVFAQQRHVTDTRLVQCWQLLVYRPNTRLWL